jgi:hypothetical protein
MLKGIVGERRTIGGLVSGRSSKPKLTRAQFRRTPAGNTPEIAACRSTSGKYTPA